jgi:hypothetical protein
LISARNIAVRLISVGGSPQGTGDAKGLIASMLGRLKTHGVLRRILIAAQRVDADSKVEGRLDYH